jgi:hypothetical protein
MQKFSHFSGVHFEARKGELLLDNSSQQTIEKVHACVVNEVV